MNLKRLDGCPCKKCNQPVTCDMRYNVNSDASVEHVDCKNPMAPAYTGASLVLTSSKY